VTKSCPRIRKKPLYRLIKRSTSATVNFENWQCSRRQAVPQIFTSVGFRWRFMTSRNTVLLICHYSLMHNGRKTFRKPELLTSSEKWPYCVAPFTVTLARGLSTNARCMVMETFKDSHYRCTGTTTAVTFKNPPTESVCVSCMHLNTNSDYFPIQH